MANIVPLLGVAVPLIGNYLQTRSAELQAEATHRESELQKANAVFDEISDAMDTLAYFNKEAMYAQVFRGGEGEWDKDTWKDYQNALIAWKRAKTTHRAQVVRYFGDAALEQLEEIQCDFDTLESQVAAAFYKRTSSQFFIEDKKGKNDFREKYLPVREALDQKMIALSTAMIASIQHQEVGDLRSE